MMIRALGWASTSAAQYYGVFAPQPGRRIHTYSGYLFPAHSAMTTDDILQWNCGHRIMFRAVQRSSPQHSRHSSLLKQWSFAPPWGPHHRNQEAPGPGRGQAAQRSLSRQLFPVRFTFARALQWMLSFGKSMNAWEVMVLWQYSPHRPTSGLTSNPAFLDNYFLCQFTFFLYLDSSSHILILILISSWFVSPFPSVFPMQRRILNHYDITFVLFMASRGNPQ